MLEATIDGKTICYTDDGPQEATPVVLVHGFPLDSRIWRHQAQALLAAGRRVICIDLPGFGQCQQQPVHLSGFSMDSLAKDIRTLLAERNALPCVLAGLSMGGYVAFAFARATPGDLAGLVLVDTKPTADNEQQKQARDAMTRLAREQGTAAVAQQMLPKVLAGRHQSGPVAEEVRKIMLTQSPDTIGHACGAMKERADSLPLLGGLKMPVLWMTGEEDGLCPPEDVRNWAGQTPGGRFQEIPGAGHLAPIEAPEAVTDALQHFMR